MAKSRILGVALVGALFAVGCSAAPGDDSEGSDEAITTRTPIQHVVVIVQENHTFDAYFGKYCTTLESSDQPTCNDGPECCQAAPKFIFSAHDIPLLPVGLDDTTNVVVDRNHDADCEMAEMDCDPNGGPCKMDEYVDVTSFGEISKLGALCGGLANYAVAKPETVSLYTQYAKQGAIGDYYFQPVAGQTSSNDMFLARAQFEFKDNSMFPARAGAKCQISGLPTKPQTSLYTGKKTIADLLVSRDSKHGFGYYHVGYDAARAAEKAGQTCAPRPADCPSRLVGPLSIACQYDPSDDPFKYYEQFGDDSPYFHDYSDLQKDVDAGNLPSVVYVKATTATDEHPGFGAISTGEAFVKKTVDSVLNNPKYAENTLVLITWDEGGGFYDHKSPPMASDGRRMGTRVPIIALGKPARKSTNGYISHVTMEHSSIIKFLEWNFLDGQTGQLNGRENSVNNIGSLIDPAMNVPDGNKTF